MGTNSILNFGASATTELTDAEYAADAQRLTGHQPGIARERLANKQAHQASLVAAGVAQYLADIQATNITDALTPAQIATMLKAATSGQTRVRGLLGNNNAGTPNTQYDFNVSAVSLRDPTTGAMYHVIAPATKTNNISTAGPAANGRDQAASFGVGVWVHFYYIYNPATAAIDTIASLSATAPAALPAGYTAWAYISAVRLDGSGFLLSNYMRGSWVTYTAFQLVVNAGTATTSTNVSTSVYCPPNALNIRVNIYNISVTSQANGAYSANCTVGIASASINFLGSLNGAAGASTQMAVGGGIVILPNVNQNYTYQLTNVTGTGPQTTHAINGYQVPNGGE